MSVAPHISATPNHSAPEPAATTPAPRLSFGARWQRFPSTLNLWLLLLLITAAGAFLRFWRVGYQGYWTDETATLYRIRGSFDLMLASLNDQGFPPGWYALLRWWCMAVEHFTHSGAVAFSTTSTRSLAAIFGTLTVPAVYFLGRQFTDRKGALLVMLLAAVNPYLIYYSRDIKMYAAMWFFTTLNLAIFFRWQTTHKHLRWWPWFLLTGLLMTVMQSMAWVMVGLQLLFLLTRPRLKSLDGPLWLGAVGLMSVTPIYWYLNRSVWIDRFTEPSGGGLSWLTTYTDMTWKTVAGLPTAHIFGYLWPSYPPDRRIREWFQLGADFPKHLATRSWPLIADAEFYAGVALAVVLVLGLIPWRGRRVTLERKSAVTYHRWWWIAVWILVPMLGLILTWIPEDSGTPFLVNWPWLTSFWHDQLWQGHAPTPIWEPRYLGFLVPAWLLWLGASLRRFPTWPLRTVLIAATVAACTFSSLANHLIYRNAPYQREAAIFMRYYNPKDPSAIASASTGIAYPRLVEEMTYDLARGQRPNGVAWESIMQDEHWKRQLWESEEYLEFLRNMRNDTDVRTILLTDRYGDITDPADSLSDESIHKLLGAGWKLDDEEIYPWHYEWRFYLFHTWRTRVWVRAEIASPTTGKS